MEKDRDDVVIKVEKKKAKHSKDKRPSDDELREKLKKRLCNNDLVFISAVYPMKPEGYNIKEQIGEGMMSNKVFLAECPERDNELVAIKQIDLSHQNEDTKNKIVKEVRSMSLVTCSDTVVRFYCSFVTDDTLWILMDLQQGSLRDVIKWKYSHGFETESILAYIIQQTLHALEFLHENQIIHRDIKANNILFNSEGEIKLADFGVSAILKNHDDRRTTMVGTWHWMAPEVIDVTDQGYGLKADIWSLGITCIELAYGDAPYADTKPNQVIIFITQNQPPSLDDPRVPHREVKDFSSAFRDFVSKCLRLEPKKRYSASKLLGHKFF
jgi:serine/threonine-protein kinase OSR1/STK39